MPQEAELARACGVVLAIYAVSDATAVLMSEVVASGTNYVPFCCSRWMFRLGNTINAVSCLVCTVCSLIVILGADSPLAMLMNCAALQFVRDVDNALGQWLNYIVPILDTKYPSLVESEGTTAGGGSTTVVDAPELREDAKRELLALLEVSQAKLTLVRMMNSCILVVMVVVVLGIGLAAVVAIGVCHFRGRFSL